MKCKGATLGITLILILSSPCAHAFGLADHEAITTQAVQELRSCIPEYQLSSLRLKNLISGDLDEDLNVIVKWWRFSHYFNPEKKLAMRRDDSSVRIRVLLDELGAMKNGKASQEDLEDEIGHLLHHFQDVASPPHVVPVNHWLTDGFESFETGLVPAPTEKEKDCALLRDVAAIDPMNLFVVTAQTTLHQVRGDFPAIQDQMATQLPWTYFWQEGANQDFGTYGVLGNRFGEEMIQTDSSRYEISRPVFQQLKRDQIRLAIQTTKKALLWMFDRGYLN